MRTTTSLVAMLALCITGSAKAQTGLSSPAPADVTAANAPPRWIRGTAIELMVLKEVNSRTAKAGDSVILRVNAPVKIGGVIVIPVGAAAHAEVIAVSGTSAAGGKGQISLRLSSAETQLGLSQASWNQRNPRCEQHGRRRSGCAWLWLGWSPD